MISILIPFMGDSRGNPSFLASWTKQKGVNQDSFEIIVVIEEESTSEEEIGVHLRTNDTLFRLPLMSEMYVAGKEMPAYREAFLRAKGRYILLTEDHVVANPDCLANIFAGLNDHPSCDGFALNSGHINRTSFSVAEGAIYDQAIEHWYHPDSWDRIRQRGTLIRRDLVEKAGGIPDEFGLFGELILSLRLWKLGARIDLLRSAKIRHVNLTDFSFFESEIRNFTAGEVDYLFASAAVDTMQLGLRAEISEGLLRHRDHSEGLRNAAQSVSREASKRFSPAGYRQLLRFIRAATPQSARRSHWHRLWFRGINFATRAMILRQIGGENMTRARMHRLWNRTAGYHAGQYLKNLEAPFHGITIHSPENISELVLASMVGFSALERVEGHPPFRWAGVVSGIYLDLEEGRHLVTLSLAGVRHPASSVATMAFFNQDRVKDEEVIQTDEAMVIEVNAAQSGRFLLVLFCDPLEAPDDPRSLGLPVSAINVQAIDANQRDA